MALMGWSTHVLLHALELQRAIRTETGFRDWLRRAPPPPPVLRPICSRWVARPKGARRIGRHPRLPPACHRQFLQSARPNRWQLKMGVALVAGLNPTSHDTRSEEHTSELQ